MTDALMHKFYMFKYSIFLHSSMYSLRVAFLHIITVLAFYPQHLTFAYTKYIHYFTTNIGICTI